jgi:hypothetical protein
VLRFVAYFTIVSAPLALFAWLVTSDPGPAQTVVTALVVVAAIVAFFGFALPAYRRDSWEWEDRLPDAPTRTSLPDTVNVRRAGRHRARMPEDRHGPTPTGPTG